MSFGGFAPSAQARPTTQIEVLAAVVNKIRAAIPVFSEETTCFVSESPDPPSTDLQDNLFCTVCPLDGSYDPNMIDGSGNLGLVEAAPILVSVFSRLERDQLERYLEGLTDPSSGLLAIKQQVLMALGGKNLDGGLYNNNGSLLLLEALMPSRSTHPRNKVYDDLASFSISFDARFWWNMNSDSELV